MLEEFMCVCVFQLNDMLKVIQTHLKLIYYYMEILYLKIDKSTNFQFPD